LLVPVEGFAQALPELTPQGILWGRRFIDNAIRLAGGGVVLNPPFMDVPVAQAVALLATVADRASQPSKDLNQDPVFVAFRDLIQTRVRNGDGAYFEDVSALI